LISAKNFGADTKKVEHWLRGYKKSWTCDMSTILRCVYYNWKKSNSLREKIIGEFSNCSVHYI